MTHLETFLIFLACAAFCLGIAIGAWLTIRADEKALREDRRKRLEP
jgi:hypothetical protein